MRTRATNPTRLISNNSSSNGQPNSCESPESSSMKTSRSLFDGISDLPNENYQIDRSSLNDDQISQSSPDKIRKQIISAKLLKPFQNIRFRKKNNNHNN